VSFFPIVLSGPIERASHLLPQLQRNHRVSFSCENVAAGVKLIIWGLFLKLVIADRTALYVDAVFGNPHRHTGVSFLAATVFYSFQVYGDFAGYSSVAIGSARLLGFDILQNFDRPYLATSIREFWRRWHMSLSTWLRDYVFLPLAYSLSRRLGRDTYAGLRTDKIVYGAAAFLTFALCGLWHGANATYLVWGALHGLYLAAENTRNVARQSRILRISRTYALVLVSWVFFRADSVVSAWRILTRIVTAPGSLFIPSGADVVAPIYAVVGIALLVMIELKREFYRGSWSFFENRSEHVRIFAYSSLLAFTVLVGVFDGGQFIYAQF
jgi:D-alanyl-lipoteichoic acid acyltransferase DltB (MBOAT superfamily)